MKYLCLTFVDEAKLDVLSQAEVEAVATEAASALSELRTTGNHVLSALAIPPQAGTSVRVRNGRMVITDIANTPGKEELNGFLVIEARDLNEALRLAARLPAAHAGYVEVRPVPSLLVEPGLQLGYEPQPSARDIGQ